MNFSNADRAVLLCQPAVSLFFPDVAPQQAKAFGTRFNRVWNRLSERGREAITLYWSASPSHHEVSIELSNLWIDSASTFGQVTFRGMKVRFSAEAFTVLPNSAADFVIAHELAHVYQWATGLPLEDDRETDANNRAVEWGFNDLQLFAIKCRLPNMSLSRACDDVARWEWPD